MAAVKVNITLQEDLLTRLDQYADENGMTRSGLIQMAARQYMDAIDNAPILKRIMTGLADLTEKVNEKTIGSDDAQQQLDVLDGQLEELRSCVPEEFRK